jgi:hypothetical protein
LGNDYGGLAGSFDFLARLTTVLPAIIGIGLGRNPTGSIHDMVVNFAPLKRVKPVLIVGLAIEAIAYVLAYTDAISNWWFVIITALVIFVLPSAAKGLVPEAYGLPERSAAAEEVPPELVGVDRPFSDADREHLDRELRLDVLRPGNGDVAAAERAKERLRGPA